MDEQLTAVMFVGVAVGAKVVGSMIARRRGHHAEESWERFTDKFRIFAVRVCMALVAGVFWGFLIAVGLRYLAPNLLAVIMSEEQSLLFVWLGSAIVIFILIWPKTSEFTA